MKARLTISLKDERVTGRYGSRSSWGVGKVLALSLALHGADSGPVNAAEGTATHDSAPAAGRGQVLSHRGDKVYLDRGLDAGLKPGQRLAVEGRPGIALEILSVGDHRAAARVVPEGAGAATGVAGGRATPLVLRGGTVVLPPPQAQASSNGSKASDKKDPAHLTQPGQQSPPGGQLAQLWRDALQGDKIEPRTFAAAKAPAHLAAHGGIETGVQWASPSPILQGSRFEQNLGLWADATDAGLHGLDVRLRADLDVRYDATPDRYLTDNRALPLVREALVRYTLPSGRLNAAAGRFKPGVRQTDLVDGLELSWTRGAVGLVAFAGLKPSSLEMLPRGDRPVIGAAVNLTPKDSALRYSGQVGYSLDLFSSTLLRQTLATDHHLRLGKLKADQSVTVDLLSAGATPSGQTGVDVGEAYLGFSYPLLTRLELDARGRYSSRELLKPDAAELPESWVEALSGRQRVRVEAGASLKGMKERSLRPYAFYRADLSSVQSGSGSLETLGGGLQLTRPQLRGSSLRLDVVGEYGDGTSQQATLQASISGPLLDHHLQLHGGTLAGWTFGHTSGNSTLQALVQVQADGTLASGVILYCSALGGMDVLVGTAAISPSAVASVEAGAGWRF